MIIDKPPPQLINRTWDNNAQLIDRKYVSETLWQRTVTQMSEKIRTRCTNAFFFRI